MLKSPPIAGPIINPAPCAAPSFPISVVRSVLLVISAMYAWATAVSVAMPATSLEIKSSRNELANANSPKPVTDIKTDNRRIGFLPTLSEAFPSIGEKINCINEKDAIRIPNATEPACKESAIKGKSGTIIPNPVASINSVIIKISLGDN